MSVVRTLRSASVLATLLVGWSAAAESTTFEQLSLEALTSHSSHVVRGRFMKTESLWSEDKTTIYTRAMFRVDEAVTGADSGEEIVVYLPGGTVGDTSILVLGAPEIEVGRDAVLMLNAVPEALAGARVAGASAFNIVGLSQGVFDLKTDSETDRTMATSHAARFLSAEDMEEGAAGPPGGAEGMTLDELIKKIREIDARLRGRVAAAEDRPAGDEGEGEQGEPKEEGAPDDKEGEEGETDESALEEGEEPDEEDGEEGEEATEDEGGKERAR